MQGSLDFRVSTESWLPQVSGFHCIGLMVGPQGHCAGVLDWFRKQARGDRHFVTLLEDSG